MRPNAIGEYLIIWLGVAIVALSGLFVGWQFWHTDRIFSGVRVAGVPVGSETRTRALLSLHKELTPYPLTPVLLEHEGRQWAFGPQSLTVEANLDDAVNRAYRVGRQGKILERVVNQWHAFMGRKTIWPEIVVLESSVRQVVASASSEVRRPSRPSLRIGTVTLPPRTGLDIDIAATTQLVLAQIARGGGSVRLQTFETTPLPDLPHNADQHSPIEPIVLRHEPTGIAFAIDAAMQQRLMPGRNPELLNEDMLRLVIEGWSRQVSYPAQDARLRFDQASQQPVVLEPSRQGQLLDIESTMAAVRKTLNREHRSITLAITPVLPKIDSRNLERLGIKELIATSTTHFGGSSDARVHNIMIAMEKFSGVVIPPGEEFSFNSTIEAVSDANGFEESAIILGDRTAVGIGGGVCQVSTTIFQAALKAGFPLLERHNHGYVVSWYGEPGFDATIYTPYVDFRFLNDSDAHLLIQPVFDSINSTISFNLYGTSPNREVLIGNALYTDFKEPSDPIYREEESLETGQIKQVEWPKQGLTVTVVRTVNENGISQEEPIVSIYQPKSAVFLYGPGTKIPDNTDNSQATGGS